VRSFIDQYRHAYGVEPICWVIGLVHNATQNEETSRVLKSRALIEILQKSNFLASKVP